MRGSITRKQPIWDLIGPEVLGSHTITSFKPLSAGIFTDFGLRLLEGRVLHKGAWVATLQGPLLGVQNYRKVKFPGRDISSLAVKGSKTMFCYKKMYRDSCVLCRHLLIRCCCFLSLCLIIQASLLHNFTLDQSCFEMKSIVCKTS